MLAKDNGGGDFENPEPGTYAATCFRVIDLGTQTSEYQGKSNTRRQVLLSWELDELMSDGRPFMVSKFYTLSLGEKANLRHDLEGWRGRAFTKEELQGFPIKKLLGVPCLLSLSLNERNKIKVASVAKLPKQMDPPEQRNESLYFSLEEFDQAAFDSLGEWVRKIIMQSPEFINRAKRPKMTDNGFPADAENLDEIPF